MQRDFRSDNVAPMAVEVLEAIVEVNRGPAGSYGADAATARLAEVAQTLFETDLAIYPVFTGTAANALALASVTPPYGAVYCHDSAHVQVDECGAPEAFTGGAKLIGLAGADGKLTPEALAAPLAEAAAGGVHHVQPAAISITQATECGTIYRPAEIAALAGTARAHGLSLHMDGARLANAVARLGCSPAEATWRAGVDVLSLGMTKNGALTAEAVVFFDRKLATGFERRRKRAGQLASKMRFCSAQLVAMLEHGRWLRYAGRANRMADRLAAGLARLPGSRLVHPVEANELFVAMPEALASGLRDRGFLFHRWSSPTATDDPVLRLVTSFATTEADVDDLLQAAAAIAGHVQPEPSSIH